jgi:catechol 2,3-dioxygenase-like lactoylglutathione lyase family enzyme
MARFLNVMPRLPVDDLATAIGYYTDVLGFAVGAIWPDESPAFVLLDREGVCVQFYVADKAKGETVGHATLSIEVDDARAVHAMLDGRTAIEWGPEAYWYGRREFAIRDPSGYLIIFSEETQDPPECHEEIARRPADLDQGRVQTIPWSEARRTIQDESDSDVSG